MNSKNNFPDGKVNHSPDVIKLKQVIHVTIPEIISMRRLMHAILVSNETRSTGRESMHQMVVTVTRFLQVNNVAVLVIDESRRDYFKNDKDEHTAAFFLHRVFKSAGIRLPLSKYLTPNHTSDVASRTIFDYAKTLGRIIS